MHKFFFTIIFSFNLYSASCDQNIHTNGKIELLEKEIGLCNNQNQLSNLKDQCDCYDKNKSLITPQIDSYNKILATSFEKTLEKSIYSISTDLALIGNLLKRENKEDQEIQSSLFDSCNIEKQFSPKEGKYSKVINNCLSNNDSFASYLDGINSVSQKVKDNFTNYFNVRKSKHINISGNSKSQKFCSENKDKSFGFVKRCNNSFQSVCDMPDNLADKIHVNKTMSDLRELLSLAKKNGLTPFNKESSIADQLAEVVFLDEENLDYRLEQLSGLDSIPHLQNLLNSSEHTEMLNSSLDEGSTNINDKMKENLFKKIKTKCDQTFKKAINFLCEENAQDPNSNKSIPEHLFKQNLTSASTKDSIQSTRYYCQVKKNHPENIEDIIKPISNEMYSVEQSRESIESMANDIAGDQSRNTREMLCADVYNKLPRNENVNSLKEEIKLLEDQMKEFESIMNKECPDGKLSQKCSYIVEMLKITEKKLIRANFDNMAIEEEIKEAKENNTKYVPRSYLAKTEQTSFAESILIGNKDKVEKQKPKAKKQKVKKEAPKEVKEETKERSTSTPPSAAFSSTQAASSENTNTVSSTSGEPQSSSLSLSNIAQAPISGLSLSQKYQSEKSKRIDDDIKNAREYLSTLTDDQKAQRIDRIKQAQFEKATQTLTKALKPNDYIEEQKHIKQHTLQDEGRIPTSTKIENPATHDLRKLQNKVLNETINSDYLASDDRIELKDFKPGDSGLINKHGLVDSDGNVLSLIEVKIKGSIEEDFTKVLEEDADKAITKDRKMILADPSQDAHFKNLAKALSEKETFLISRYDNEDIKLIIKYNNQNKDYTVEPYADKERLSIYEKDYLEFQANISNAIKDKTFKTLMDKYKKKPTN